MNINIALSTIIYIMVFLFPGLIFRKSFFSGVFKNHYDKNSLFEKFVWNLFFSISIIAAIVSINYFFIEVLSIKPLLVSEINGEIILGIFKNIYKSDFPIYLTSVDKLYDIMLLLFITYGISYFLGLLINWIITYLRLHHSISNLNFLNNWDYLTQSNKENNFSHKYGDIHITYIDIKTKSNELFSGKLFKIIYNNDGSVNSFILKEAFKYYKIKKKKDNNYDEKIVEIENKIENYPLKYSMHFKNAIELIYKKSIKGEMFSIYNENIENVSIFYFKVNNNFQTNIDSFLKILKNILNIVFVCIILFLLSFVFFEYGIYKFDNYFKRFLFSIISSLELSFIYSLIKLYIELKKYHSIINANTENLKKTCKTLLWLIALFLPIYLYIFSLFNLLFAILISVIVFFYFAYSLSKEVKKNLK